MTDIIESLLNGSIDHLKKSPVLKAAAATADAAMDRINALLHKDPVSLDALVADLSNDTDKLILDAERNEGLTYVGGQLVAIAPASDTFELVLKLYFKASDDKVILKESRKELAASILLAESLHELNAQQKISFEVDLPAQGS